MASSRGKRRPPVALREAGNASLLAESREHVRRLDASRIELKEQNEQLHQAQQDATASRDFYADAFDAAPLGYVLMDREGRLRKINRQAARLFGDRRDNLLGRSLVDLLDDSDRLAFQDHLGRCTSEHPVDSVEVTLKPQGDRSVHVELRTEIIKNLENCCAGYRTVLIDTAESHKNNIETLVESEMQYSRLVEQARDGVVIVQDESLVFANRACAEMLGYSREALFGMALVEIVTEEQRELVVERYRRRIAGEDVPSPYEVRLLCRDGTSRNIELSAERIIHKGRPATMAVIRDVTERKRAEVALRKESERARKYLDVAGVMILAVGLDERVSLVNRKGCDVLGFSEEEILGANWFDTFLPERIRERLKNVFAKLTTEGEVQRLDWYVNPVTTKNGHERLILWHNAILKDEEGRITGTLASGEDITERKQAEDALRESERKYKALVEGTLQGILVIRDSRILFANHAAGDIFHMSPDDLTQLAPAEVRAFSPSGDWPEEIQRCASYADTTLRPPDAPARSYQLFRKDGSSLWIEAVLSTIQFNDQPAVQVAFIDRTQRKAVETQLQRTEAQLAHAGRLAEMGELVAGIVHEINQPLYAIQNFAKATCHLLAAGNPPDLDDLRQWNEEILMAATCASNILERQRAFTRRTESQRAPAAVNDIIAEAVRLLDCEAQRHRISVKTDLAASSLMVQADRIQIQQVVVNLLRNAFESVRLVPKESRHVTIRAQISGDSVRISLLDNGLGLPSDGGQAIFEPFVSTKANGLGVGLTISKTIVDAHGGMLWAEAPAEGGAVFHFTLPLATGGPADGE